MFTGIVQSLGHVQSLIDGVLLVRPAEGFAPDGYDEGESIAINGVCLTVTPNEDASELRFDLSEETLNRSSLGQLDAGSAVNLERAMSATSRFGGHIVQGHVDATGTYLSSQPEGNSIIMRFAVPLEYDRYLIDKGSITIDGISLTVVEPKDGEFSVWVIPHTVTHTNLGTLKPGDKINLEFDVVAKYVEKLLTASGRLTAL